METAHADENGIGTNLQLEQFDTFHLEADDSAIQDTENRNNATMRHELEDKLKAEIIIAT